MSNFTKHGGKWLAATRSWIQHNFINGDTVIWGSNDTLRGRTLTAAMVEEIAATAVDAAFTEVDDLKEENDELHRKLLWLQINKGSLDGFKYSEKDIARIKRHASGL